VISKSIPPINPLDNERSHMYIYNNIFFSFALDSRDTYKDIGGDKIAYAGANNDLNGVKLYNLTVITKKSGK
jgi:protein TIF31